MRLAGGSDAGGGSDKVLTSIENRIQVNWDEQAEGTRASREDYMAEVRQRFGAALSTVLASDRELLGASITEGESPLNLSLRLERYYERQEQYARQAAALAFGEQTSDPVLHARCVRRLHDLLLWLRPRWWLKLMSEDSLVYSARGGASDEQLRRAEHAVNCLQCQEVMRRRVSVFKGASRRFLEHFGKIVPPGDQQELQRQISELLEHSATEQHWLNGCTASWHRSVGGTEICCDAKPRCIEADGGFTGDTDRALLLAGAAGRSWKVNRLLELVGVLTPPHGREAKRIAAAVDGWVNELEQRSTALRNLLAQHTDRIDWQRQVALVTNLVDVARRSVFQLALEYCGGTRGTVRRRGERRARDLGDERVSDTL